MAKRKNKEEEFEGGISRFFADLSPDAKRGIFTVFLFALAILSGLSLADSAGQAGGLIKEALSNLLGWTRFLVPVLLGFLSVVLFFDRKFHWRGVNYIGIVLFALSFNALLHVLVGPSDFSGAVLEGKGGGYLGFALAYPLEKFLGIWGGLVVIIAVFVISVSMMFNTSIQSLIFKLRERAAEGEEEEIVDEYEQDEFEEEGEEEEEEESEEDELEEEQPVIADEGEAAINIAYKKWQLFSF